jgi:AcrR family transcriptional regulator
MSKPPASASDSDRPVRKRQRYHSPLRQQQSQETRARIVSAGAQIVHGLPAWDWTSLTVRAVAEAAGVSERTVHRHFASERQLREAILQRLQEESGIDLEAIELDTFADEAARLFRYLDSFAVEHVKVSDPALDMMDIRRRAALRNAVERATPGWEGADRDAVAAVLDLLWNPPSHERLVVAWGLSTERAATVLTWLIRLVEEAVRNDRRPD